MKSLYVMRHAKSSWEQNLDDFDRPLNHRGFRDAPAMADRLKDENIQWLVSSSANRALSTARILCKNFYGSESNLTVEDGLYLASPEKLLIAALQLNDEYDRILIVAHNPGVSEFLAALSNEHEFNMPTGSVGRIDFDVEEWRDLDWGNGKLNFFAKPKDGF